MQITRSTSLAVFVFLALIGAVLSVAPGSAQGQPPEAPPDPAALLAPDQVAAARFTYQGRLTKDGQPYTGLCDFQFSLWDAVINGTEVEIPVTVANQSVASGLFAAPVDLRQFYGEARWLEASVRCPAGSGAYTTLAPRTEITAAPYALGLRPGAKMLPPGSAADPTAPSFTVATTATLTSSLYPIAIYGQAAEASSYGIGFVDRPVGIAGFSSNGYGVYGATSSNSGPVAGVTGRALGLLGYGVWGQSDNEIGVYGESANEYAGWFDGRVAGVFFGRAACCDEAGVVVHNFGTAVGLWATNYYSNAGIFGQGRSAGVVGEATQNGGIGVQGRLAPGLSGLAGQFLGNVDITGNILAPTAAMRIDHPLNPTGEYLNQAYIAAPEQLNVYSGNVTTDADGTAVITLPVYVEALNTDFRYQLTPIGQFAQAIVAAELQNGSFTIRTDKPFVKVSWQVTGVRQDAYAKYSPLVVEQAKPLTLQGLYQNPQAFSQPVSSGEATVYDKAVQATASSNPHSGAMR